MVRRTGTTSNLLFVDPTPYSSPGFVKDVISQATKAFPQWTERFEQAMETLSDQLRSIDTIQISRSSDRDRSDAEAHMRRAFDGFLSDLFSVHDDAMEELDSIFQ